MDNVYEGYIITDNGKLRSNVHSTTLFPRTALGKQHVEELCEDLKEYSSKFSKDHNFEIVECEVIIKKDKKDGNK